MQPITVKELIKELELEDPDRLVRVATVVFADNMEKFVAFGVKVKRSSKAKEKEPK